MKTNKKDKSRQNNFWIICHEIAGMPKHSYWNELIILEI